MNKKVIGSVLILLSYVVAFVVVSKMMTTNKEKDESKPTSVVEETQKNDATKKEESMPLESMSEEQLIEKANALIDELYVEPTREEVEVHVQASIYEEIEEVLDLIEDEEQASALQLDTAMSISHLYFQEEVREALADEEVLQSLTDEDMEEFALSFESAQLYTPSFAEYIEPEYQTLLEKYEEVSS